MQDLEIDHVQALLQSKVHDVEAQGKEFAAMAALYSRMTARLAGHADERRALQRRAAKLEQDVEAARRDGDLARHAANDAAKQVRRLLYSLFGFLVPGLARAYVLEEQCLHGRCVVRVVYV